MEKSSKNILGPLGLCLNVDDKEAEVVDEGVATLMPFFIWRATTEDVERDRLFRELRFCGCSLKCLCHALGFGNAAEKALAAEGLNLLLELEDVKLILQFGYYCFGRTMPCENMEVFTVEQEFFEALRKDGKDCIVNFFAKNSLMFNESF